MIFETTIEGFPASVIVENETRVYRVRLREVDASLDRSYETIEAAETAVKRYNLTQRKGFTNPTAYRRGGEVVEVTSICEGGRECWIARADGRREKASLSSLYANADEVSSASERERQIRDEIVQLWSDATRWAPEWPAKESV